METYLQNIVDLLIFFISVIMKQLQNIYVLYDMCLLIHFLNTYNL